MKTWQWLGYLGVLPFYISLAIGLFMQDWHDEAAQVFVFYSAIILSFLAGSLWQVKVEGNNERQQVISNLFALTAFAALMMPIFISIITLALAYLLLFYYENFVVRNTDSKTTYLKVRFNLTSLVVLSHALALYFWTAL